MDSTQKHIENEYNKYLDLYEYFMDCFPFTKTQNENLSRLIGDVSGKTILERASSTGKFLFSLAKFNPKLAIGTDISEESIVTANKVAKEKNLNNYKFFKCDSANFEEYHPFLKIKGIEEGFDIIFGIGC